MRIAYHSTDELNRELAARAAKSCGADIDLKQPRAGRVPGPSAPTLYDLDHLGAEHKQAVLDELLSGRAPRPAAVHGYDLPDDVAAALHERGVVVSRRVGPEVVQQLCELAGPPPEAGSDRDDADGEPDRDDPAALGTLVRSLASSAHRILSSRGGRLDGIHADAIAAVVEKLDQLQHCIDRLRRLHDLQLEEIRRWANNLRRIIDERL